MDTSWTNKFCAQSYVKAWGWMKKKCHSTIKWKQLVHFKKLLSATGRGFQFPSLCTKFSSPPSCLRWKRKGKRKWSKEKGERELSVSFSYMLKALVSCSALSCFILTALRKLNHLSSPSSTTEASMGIDLTIKTRLGVPFLLFLKF